MDGGPCGYRACSIAQQRDLNRVVALRGLGFSLAEVRQLLSGITAVGLRGMPTDACASLGVV